ncbi:hypothetical protein E2562_035229 [Oryza meyeriana var. granulata]|uniref:Uncharacterized protein n=1 Tax=Oryza meyeriana var. granulata TaxID=110450 RepID=A0A6G1ESL6_9ORYZ|nr:hypothetical protein E2562_035229 [Oryza meyeriana var. granulata]
MAAPGAVAAMAPTLDLGGLAMSPPLFLPEMCGSSASPSIRIDKDLGGGAHASPKFSLLLGHPLTCLHGIRPPELDRLPSTWMKAVGVAGIDEDCIGRTPPLYLHIHQTLDPHVQARPFIVLLHGKWPHQSK